jgi:hypothetical protein
MRPASAILLLTSACLCAARSADAAEWSAAPVLSWTVDHDSNRPLSIDKEPGQGAYVQLDLLLRRATGTSSLSLRPHVDLQRYSGDSASDSDNQLLQAAGVWHTERSIFNAQATLAHENTLNSALVDTGIVGLDTRRRSKIASLSWTREQTKDRHQLAVHFSYADVDYRLSAYRYPSLALTESIGWSPRGSLQLTAYGSTLDSDAMRENSDSVGAQIGLSYDITARISASFAGGLSRQYIGNIGNSGYTGELGLTRRDVLGHWRLFGERSVTASGFGALVTRTEAGLVFERRLAPRWNGTLALRHVGNEDIGPTLSGEVHRYERVDAGLGWQATRTWTINAAAAVNWLERTANSPLAEGWRAILSATWTPQPRMLSR